MKMFLSRCKKQLLVNLLILLHFASTAIAIEVYSPLILTTHNLPPYGSFPHTSNNQIIADDTFTGVAVDKLKCILKKMNVMVEIQVLPWKRAQSLVQTGAADGFFAASQNESRDQYATITAPIAKQQWTWYLLKENPLNPQHDDFRKNATVAGFYGANMLKWMEEHDYNIQSVPQDTATLLKVLLAKRVDAIMANNYVMDALLKEQGQQNNVKSYNHKDKPLSVYISKEYLRNNPTFIEHFNSCISECE